MENQNQINQLLDEIKIIFNHYSKLSREAGENFNVFSLLRNESDEVRLHSRFIAELLDPKGSHEQGITFLKIFLEVFEIDDINPSASRVDVEHCTGLISKDKTRGGNIDIMIDDGTNCVKIENKIYAGEQKNQLLRYHNYKKGHLVFLTLFGNQSDMHSYLIDKEIQYDQRSYKDDIAIWLERCVEKMAAIPRLKETITQYLNLVKKLTNQNTNKKMSNHIVSKIIENKESFDAYLAIRKTEDGDDIYKNIARTLLIPFFENFALENSLKVHNLERSLISKREQFSGFYFSNEKLESIGLKLAVLFYGDNNKHMSYGLSYRSKNPKTNTIFEKLQIKSKKVMHKPKEGDERWLSFSFWPEYNNWTDIYTIHRIVYGDFQNLFKMKMKNILSMVYDTINEQNDNF